MGSRVFDELKRRNVFRVGAAYLAGAWLLLQVTATVVPALHLPVGATTVVTIVLIAGLPVALLMAWLFEITPAGLVREDEAPRGKTLTVRSERRLDLAIIGVLAVAVAYFAVDKLVFAPRRDAALVESTARAFEQRATEASRAQKSIAVLPFANMSADPEQAYFADGLAEELLNLLAQIPELRVAARTSSFSFRDRADLATIAGELNVRHLLEGSVRKSGDTLRITTKLVDAESGFQLWSQRYDRKMEDVFAIQDEIAASVVDALNVSLMGKMPVADEIDPDAYALYLRAKATIARGDPEEAVRLLRSALDREPGYAPAWVQLAWAYWTQVSHQQRDVHEGMALARDAVERALESNDRFAEAYIARGWIQLDYEWDWPGANESMRRGLELAPRNSEVFDGAGVLALSSGRVEDSLALFGRALELDPLSLPTQFNFGSALLTAGRFGEAAAAYRKALEIHPDARFVHASIGLALLLQDEPEAASKEMEAETDPLMKDFGIALARFSLGPRAGADRALAGFVEAYGESAPFHVASIHAWRGEADAAFEWLDVAFDRHASELSTILSDPLMTTLRADPRWPEFLDRLGAPH